MRTRAVHLGTRRVFRLGLTTALALAAGYALDTNMPFLAPLFGFLLTAQPKPPMGLKGLLGLLLVIAIMLSVGLLLLPVLQHYPATGLLLVLFGLFLANYLSLNLGKGPVGTLLVIGVAMITMIGQVAFALAVAVIGELMLCIAIAIVCQWLVYPLFPEDAASPPAPPVQTQESKWLAARATLIVFPTYLLGLTNPTFYTPIILKSVALGQQAGETEAKSAGRELLGSTLVAGMFAAVFWLCLKIAPNLWMFFLWTLAFGTYISAKLYGVLAGRFTPGFWQNVMTTLLILVGPAVADSANGKDPYKAFLVRMGLFIAVTLYAWMAMLFLEHLRERGRQRRAAAPLMPAS